MDIRKMGCICGTMNTAPEEIMGIVLPQLPEDVQDDVRQIFVEAISNARIHGNRNDPEKSLRVLVAFSDRFIKLTIENDGEGWDHEVWEAKVDELRHHFFYSEYPLADNLDEHGRGIVIMKILADNLTYHRGGRKIVVFKRFGKNSKSEVLGCNVSMPIY